MILETEWGSYGWTTQSKPYCESLLFDGPPEYANLISALTMSIIGYLGLKLTVDPPIGCKVVYICFILNGIFSCLNHATLHIIWAFSDEFSLFFGWFFGVWWGYDELLYAIFVRNRDQPSKHYYSLFSNAILFAMIGIAILECVLDVIYYSSSQWPAFICIAIGFVVAFCGLIGQRSLLKKEVLSNDRHGFSSNVRRLWLHLKIGIGLFMLMAAIWIATETPCHDGNHHWIMFIPTHALWHIFATYGVHTMAQFALFFSGVTSNQNPHFRGEDSNGFLKWFYRIFPIVVMENSHLDTDFGSNHNTDPPSNIYSKSYNRVSPTAVSKSTINGNNDNFIVSWKVNDSEESSTVNNGNTDRYQIRNIDIVRLFNGDTVGDRSMEFEIPLRTINSGTVNDATNAMVIVKIIARLDDSNDRDTVSPIHSQPAQCSSTALLENSAGVVPFVQSNSD